MSSAPPKTGSAPGPAPALAPIHLLVGDVGLLVREAEEQLISDAFEGRSPGFNMASFSAETGGWSAMDMAKTPPMMARRRVVVIREMEKASVELLDALMAYADKPVPTTLLVLVGEKLPAATGGVDRGRRLENKLKEGGGVKRFKSADQDPAGFAISRAAEAGCTLDRRAASLLVDRVGQDLGRLDAEVEKMAAFVGGKGAIGADVVEQVTSLVAEAVIWALTDAVLARDADHGLAALHRLLEDGEPSHRLLAMVSWQMRQLLELQDSMVHNAPEPASWARMPHAKKSAARQALQQRPLSPSRLLAALARTNREMNRSPAGDRRIFEGLIMELTAR